MANIVAGSPIKGYVERIERLEKEKLECDELIKEVFAEAKGNGFDVAALKRLLKRRAQDPAQRAEQQALDDLYEDACR